MRENRAEVIRVEAGADAKVESVVAGDSDSLTHASQGSSLI
jgi:hypothetical protein